MILELTYKGCSIYRLDSGYAVRDPAGHWLVDGVSLESAKNTVDRMGGAG